MSVAIKDKGKGKETSEEKKERLIAALKKKRECEAKALSVVHKLIETENPVCPDWLLENVQHISQCHYQDAVEERAVVRVCGYPLCQNKLTDIPKKKYHISLKAGKVYDIQERKNFCSNKCYGASVFFKKQLLTSPLWMRTPQEIPKFQLLDPPNAHGLVGDEVFVRSVARLDINEPAESEKTQLTAETNQELRESPPPILQLEEKVSKLTIQPPKKVAKPSPTPKAKVAETNISEIAWNAVQQWTTPGTVRFLLGPDKFAEVQPEPKSETIASDPRYVSLCKKLDVEELQDAAFDRHLTAAGQNAALKPMPSFEQLKRDAEEAELRVRAFYSGKTVIEPSVEPSADREKPNGSAADEDPVVLPPVDAHAQKLLRKRIVSGQLERTIPDLARTLNIPYADIRQDVKELVSTFAFSADNITFKPDGWSLIGLLVIKMTSLKSESVRKRLNAAETERFVQLMLLGTGAPRDFLENFTTWITEYAVHSLRN